MSEKTKTVIVAIIYHSGYGHTKKLATAVAQGVDNIENATSLLLDVDEAQTKWEALEAVDAIIFGAPTYMVRLPHPSKYLWMPLRLRSSPRMLLGKINWLRDLRIRLHGLETS